VEPDTAPSRLPAEPGPADDGRRRIPPRGNLASYTTAPELQPGGSMDTVLQGLGYPASITTTISRGRSGGPRTSAAAAATRASAGCGR